MRRKASRLSSSVLLLMSLVLLGLVSRQAGVSAKETQEEEAQKREMIYADSFIYNEGNIADLPFDELVQRASASARDTVTGAEVPIVSAEIKRTGNLSAKLIFVTKNGTKAAVVVYETKEHGETEGECVYSYYYDDTALAKWEKHYDAKPSKMIFLMVAAPLLLLAFIYLTLGHKTRKLYRLVVKRTAAI